MITHVLMKLEGAVIELTRGSVLLDGKPYVHNLKLSSLFFLPVGSLSEHPFPSSDLTFFPSSWRAQVFPEYQQKKECLTKLIATSEDYPRVQFVQMSYIPDAAPLLQ